jgi:segregation and condensation protein B
VDHLALHIESLIFVAEHALPVKEIKTTLEECFETSIKKEDIESAISDLQEKYKDEQFSMELVSISNGYQFLTKEIYHHTVGTYLKQLSKKKLSKSALETLSIIAYRQPVTKSDIEMIRGVNCDYAVQKLLEKELVEISGRSEAPGRPLLYITSSKFMDYFGLKSMKDLPKLQEFEKEENQIGEQESIEVEITPSDLEEE